MSLNKSWIWGFLLAPLAVSWGIQAGCHHAQCEVSAECPPALGDCVVAGCFDGTCRQVPASVGAECSVGVCDANGECGCDVLTDCARFGDECNVPSCDADGCHSAPAQDGTPCRIDDSCGESECQAGACVTTPFENGTPCSLGSAECSPPGRCLNDVCTADSTCEAKGVHTANDTQDTAYSIGFLTDCDEFTLCDSLVPGQEDWYVYSGRDTDCEIFATVDIDTPSVEICQYWECLEENLTVTTCPFGTTEVTAPNGQFGCCGTGEWRVDPCNGDFLDDGSATVWLRVREKSGQQLVDCEPYELYMEF